MAIPFHLVATIVCLCCALNLGFGLAKRVSDNLLLERQKKQDLSDFCPLQLQCMNQFQ